MTPGHDLNSRGALRRSGTREVARAGHQIDGMAAEQFAAWLQLFLIHRYEADALHYLTPTADNESQAQAMKRLGIFNDVNTEVGKIIVADVNKERVAELVGADQAALRKFIRKTAPGPVLSAH